MELFNHNILPYSYSHKYQFFLQLQHVDSDIVASFIECEDFFFFDITSSSQDRTKQILLLGSQGGSGSLNERKTHVDISARRSQDDYDDEDEEDRSIAKFSTLGAYTMDRSRRCSAPRRAASHVLSCGFTMLHAAAAFRLRRRTVKQRKSKSRSQGDKYRPTGVHMEHGCLRRVLRTKVKRDRAHANACGTKALFPCRHCSENVGEKLLHITIFLITGRKPLCAVDAPFAVAYF